jgi:hypothetical protein
LARHESHTCPANVSNSPRPYNQSPVESSYLLLEVHLPPPTNAACSRRLGSPQRSMMSSIRSPEDRTPDSVNQTVSGFCRLSCFGDFNLQAAIVTSARIDLDCAWTFKLDGHALYVSRFLLALPGTPRGGVESTSSPSRMLQSVGIVQRRRRQYGVLPNLRYVLAHCIEGKTLPSASAFILRRASHVRSTVR